MTMVYHDVYAPRGKSIYKERVRCLHVAIHSATGKKPAKHVQVIAEHVLWYVEITCVKWGNRVSRARKTVVLAILYVGI